MFGAPSRRLIKHLDKVGVKAPATVVEIADSGMAVSHGGDGVVANTKLAMKTQLRVHPANGEAEFEVSETFRYPQLQVPGVGSQVAVIYDPENHDQVMLDESAPAQAAVTYEAADAEDLAELLELAQASAGVPDPSDQLGQLERLAALREQGMLTDAEFAAQKARILGG